MNRNRLFRSSVRYLAFTLTRVEKITLDEQIRRVARQGARKPSEIYETLASEKIINDDQFQRQICIQLDHLSSRLAGHHPTQINSPSSQGGGFFSKFFSSSSTTPPPQST